MTLPDFRPIEGSKLTDELSCSICLGVLNNPVELAECGHLYCYSCLFGQPVPSQGSPKTRSSTLPPSFDGSITHPLMTTVDLAAKPRVSTCPQCRTAVGKVKEPHRALKNLLGALDGSCAACQWRGTHSEYPRHAPCFRRGHPQSSGACSSAPLPPQQPTAYPPQPYTFNPMPTPAFPQQQQSYGSFPVLPSSSSASYPPPAPPPASGTDGPLGVSNSGYYRNPFSGSLMKNQHAR